MNIDLFYFLYGFAYKSTSFNKTIYFFADIFPYIFLIAAFLFVIFYFKIFNLNKLKENFNKVLPIGISFVSALLLAKVFKIFFHTLRPFIRFSDVTPLFYEKGFAFPSGHAFVFSALAFSIFFVNKKIGYVFLLSAFFIGVARIMAGVHFPVDILGGFLLGFIVAFLSKRV